MAFLGRGAAYLMRETRERLRYRLDNLFASGSLAQLVLLAILVVLVVLFGMSAVFFGLFSPENQEVEGIGRNLDGGFLDALWWSMKHIFDPAFFDMNYGASLPVVLISLAISIMGLLLFGILIGFIATGIEGRLEGLKRGNSPVKEQGHLLILGWSNKIFSILDLLADSEIRLRVVILANHDIQAMQEMIRVAVGRKLRNRVILRTGSPSSYTELERVAFDRAYSIIVLADHSVETDEDDIDARVIKTLVLLASFDGWHGQRPKITAEIGQKENQEIAEIAGNHQIPIVSSSEVISKIIVQSSRQEGLSAVYTSLFSFAESELYVRSFPACAGKTFGAILHMFPHAIPIGLSSAYRVEDQTVYLPRLNPPVDHVIEEGDWIILVAEHGRIELDDQAMVRAPRQRPQAETRQVPREKILILGWNSNLYDVLREFDGYVSPGTSVHVVASHEPEAATELCREHIGRPLVNLVFDYRKHHHFTRGVFKDLIAEMPDLTCLILLADESSHEKDPDARTITTLLLLRDLQKRESLLTHVHVVSEILEPTNRELLASARVADVIISPETVSMFITQISQQQMLKLVYEELLNSGGVEIYLKPASRYVPLDAPATFRDLMQAASGMSEIAIGLKLASTDTSTAPKRGGVFLNPAKEQRWILGEHDKVVVIAENLHDPAT
jgi:hypothetical protein